MIFISSKDYFDSSLNVETGSFRGYSQNGAQPPFGTSFSSLKL